MLRTAVVAFFITWGSVIPAAAADTLDAPTAVTSMPAAESALASDVDWSLPAVHFGAVERSRGPVLAALYAGLGALNTFDVVSTSKAVSRGAKEVNPLMRSIAARPAAMWAVKGGVTAATIFTAERLWRNNRKAQAILMMVGSNAVMTAVAFRNASVIRQQR